MTVFTPANQLTLLRMLMIPAFVILVVYGELGWALGVFVTAGITDGLDGLIARRSGKTPKPPRTDEQLPPPVAAPVDAGAEVPVVERARNARDETPLGSGR